MRSLSLLGRVFFSCPRRVCFSLRALSLMCYACCFVMKSLGILRPFVVRVHITTGRPARVRGWGTWAYPVSDRGGVGGWRPPSTRRAHPPGVLESAYQTRPERAPPKRGPCYRSSLQRHSPASSPQERHQSSAMFMSFRRVATTITHYQDCPGSTPAKWRGVRPCHAASWAPVLPPVCRTYGIPGGRSRSRAPWRGRAAS